MLDIKRCAIYTNLGILELDDACGNFEGGTLLQKIDDNGTTKLTISDGTNPAGMAKWDHALGFYGLSVSEAHTFPTGAPVDVNLDNGQVIASTYKVEDSAGANYTEGGGADYTMNTTNGIVTRVGGSAIPDGGTVYVTYKWQKTDAQIDAGDYPFGLIGGRNLRNQLDDVPGSNRMTLIQGYALIYTTVFDSSLDYTVGEKIYSDAAGQITNVAGGNPEIGSVHELPSTDDAFLGVELKMFTPGT